MRDSITPAQQEALDKASEMLGEHFDAHVVVVGWESIEGETSYNTTGSWNGGIPTVIGLCDLYHEKLTRMHLESAKEDDPE